MWIMTPRGFYSVVQKKEDGPQDMLTVRARCKEDIERLADLLPGCKVTSKKFTDYAWRLRCTRTQWAEALVTMTAEIDYSNFKDEVKAKRGAARAGIYSSVWSVLLRLEDRKNGGLYGTPHGGFTGTYQDRLPSTSVRVLPSADGTYGDECLICGTRACKDSYCMDQLSRDGWFGADAKKVATGKRGSRRGARGRRS